MYGSKLDITPKTTERNLIVRTSKSEAEVRNNKKIAVEVLHYWSNEADVKHRVASVTAQLLVILLLACYISVSKTVAMN